MSLTTRLKRGVLWGGAISALLILVPPLFVDNLDAWEAALVLLTDEKRIGAVCGPDSKVSLSRWFYTYHFSGGSAHARFNGVVSSPMCEKSFTVQLQNNNQRWEINDIHWR